MTTSVTMNKMTLPFLHSSHTEGNNPYQTEEKEPMKVASTFCVVTSSTTKRVALGVTLVVAEP